MSQERIHNQCLSNDLGQRRHAVEQLKNLFSSMPEKQQAWDDLLRLAKSGDAIVSPEAAEALGSVFSQVPDEFKQQAWDDLHRLTNDEEIYLRSKAAEALGSAFSQMSDEFKQQAWDDLHRLTVDNDDFVRSCAAEAIGSAFSQAPDEFKQQAWNDLYRLTNDYFDGYVRSRASDVLASSFPHVPDKQQAWNDLLRLTNNGDYEVRSKAAEALSSVFSQVPDEFKQQAWNDLLRLASNEDEDVKYSAAKALGFAFSQVPDEFKQQAWDDLHRLTNDEETYLRSSAAEALGFAFSQVPDEFKQQAWDDLHRLTNDYFVRSSAAEALGFAFSQVPDEFKQQAWDDLHRLTDDSDHYVRENVVKSLGSAFSQVPDEFKQQAWDDLLRLASDEDENVKYSAAETLGSVFSYVSYKQQAWDDLHRLTNDDDGYVGHIAAKALGFAFSQVPNEFKQQAWDDLHRLTNDEETYLRSSAAEALGFAFSQVPDEFKQQAWDDLQRMANDEDFYVRTSSNHSLGKVCIFKASQAETEENYKEGLEKAIEFFKEATLESLDKKSNPSNFCLPFYRSFYTIIYKKHEAKKQVDRYLAEAKTAIEDSKSKELLFEAVENLANALKDIQSLENLDFEVKKSELYFCRNYCERAAELMMDTKECAPSATEVLIKGLPFFKRNVKELLEEIQKKAKIVCNESKGTSTEEIACAVNREVQKWETGSQEEMAFCAKNLAYSLKLIIPPIPDNESIRNEIDKALNEKDLINLFIITSTFIGSIPTLKMVTDKLNNLENLVIEVNSRVDELVIISKPGIKEELEISSGIEFLGTGMKHIVKIPLQEISYAELKEDLERIKGKKIEKLSQLPFRLAEKLKSYLVRIGRNDILKNIL